jgi:hypothetical protein
MPARPPVLVVLALAAALAAAAVPLTAQTFVFHLRGVQEVPPVPSPASGGCMGVLDQGAQTFDVTCTHDVVGPTLIHIHRAAAGANGPAVFDLGNPTSPVVATWTGMTAGDVADLLAGDLYVNIHTAGRPDGEIRGQVLPRTVDTVNFTADGAQMVPPNATAATATCTADLDDPATALDVQCTHDVPAPDAAHLHSAPFGENGPVVHTFASPSSPMAESVPMSPVLVADFAAAFLYVEIHEAPAGEGTPVADIRGQIGDPPPAPTTGTVRILKSTFPPGGAGFGFIDDIPGSPGTFTLDDGQVETFLGVPPGTYTVIENDPGASPGGFALTHVECQDDDSTGDRFARTATVRVVAGEVVTCVFENLELAGGALPFVFGLDGGQEVPPVASPATGGCVGFLDQPGAQFTLVCTHNVVGPTLMHVHRGAAGAIGPVVFDLGDPASPVLATWTGMSPADVADLLAGNLYVNIHTGGRPDGEIRGQILERTHDQFTFGLEGAQQVPPVATAARGRCFADLDAAATALFLECTHDVAGATAAHIHQAPFGENGPVLIELGDPASPFALAAPLSPRDVADLVAGFLYVNVHSADAPDGEIRGQIVDGLGLLAFEIPVLSAWGALLLGLGVAGAALRRLASTRRV